MSISRKSNRYSQRAVSENIKSTKTATSGGESVQRVNVDFGASTLAELDRIANELNVSRQAVIKLFLQRELDRHFLAKKARRDATE